MVDIGTSDKITNLWPTTATASGRSIKQGNLKDKSSKHQQREKKQKNEDGPGKNIDEYA